MYRTVLLERRDCFLEVSVRLRVGKDSIPRGMPILSSGLCMASTHDLAALSHHMRKQDIRSYNNSQSALISLQPHADSQNKHTRHINQQNSKQPLPNTRKIFRRPHRNFPHQSTLTANSQRIKHKESIVTQPQPEVRDTASGKVDGKVGVANYFGDGPGDEHGAVDGGEGDGGGEGVDDAPDQEDAAGDLHEGCEEGGAYDA
jgi:hypothetical protein